MTRMLTPALIQRKVTMESRWLRARQTPVYFRSQAQAITDIRNWRQRGRRATLRKTPKLLTTMGFGRWMGLFQTR